MKLPIPFLSTKKESSVYFLALLLNSEKASAVILEESLGKLKIIGRQNQFFSENIENLSLDELIDNVDKAISRAEEVLPPDIEIHKTVFGVKEGWVEKETKKIKKDYLHKLKKVCDSLDLSPIGFMVVSEAISHLMQQEEGAPMSAIFAELSKKTVTLTLLRGGKGVHVVEGEMKDSYAGAVDELLKHFTVEVLPARIILYDTEISEELAQQFIGHQWSKSLPFLHMPQISVLPPGFDGRAVTFGAATQMGFEVLDDQTSEIKTYDHGGEKKSKHTGTHKHETAISETKEEAKHTKPTTATPDSLPTENFGFVIGEDIGKQEKPSEDLKSEIESDSLVDTSPIKEERIIPDQYVENVAHASEGRSEPKRKSLPTIGMPRISFPNFPSFGTKIFIIPFIVFLLAGGVIGGAYYFYTNNVNASVLVSLTPKKATETRDVEFGVESGDDFSNNIISAKSVSGSIDGELTIGASGKKDVGDKAKGNVTIYNNDTDSDADLPSGSSIKSDNGLAFTLDKDVTVASASGDIFSGTKPGTATVDVTAADIGTNYNLPSGTKFSVASNNALAAKNDDAFSGGTKKTVTVVSKEDLVKLKTDLLKNLEEKANEQLSKKTQKDAIILPIVLSTSVENTKYDKDVGDETKTVKLTASISFSGLAYQEEVVKNFSKEILQKNYSEDMTFDESSLDLKVEDAKKESDKEISATLIMNASLLPKIETEEIAKELSGKSKQEAESILSRIPQVEATEIVYKPNIYFLSSLFPRLPNHVTVTLSSN